MFTKTPFLFVFFLTRLSLKKKKDIDEKSFLNDNKRVKGGDIPCFVKTAVTLKLQHI